MEGINKYSKEWFALNNNSEYIEKAESLKDGVDNLILSGTYGLDGSLFVGDKETVMNNIDNYYKNSTKETAGIINNLQTFGAENIFNVLDENSDGIVTEKELSDIAGSGVTEGSSEDNKFFSIMDLYYLYRNATEAQGAIVEKTENTIKITYTDGEYTELKTDENGAVYSKYYEKIYDKDRIGVEYNTKDESKTRIYLDSENRPTKIFYDKEGTKFDFTAQYTYNDDGSKVVETETIGKKVITQYDSLGNTISENLELKYNSDGIIDDTKQQIDTQTCWLLSGVNALRTTEKGAELIKNSIKQNEDGSVTVYLNGVNKSYTYTPEDIVCGEEKYSTGDDDMTILMMAVADFRSEKIANGTRTFLCGNLELCIGNDVTLEEPLNWGMQYEAIYYLTGLNSKFGANGANKEEKTELLNEYLKADKSNIAATISFNEADKSIDNNISTRHAYSIVGSDEKNVYVENPANAGISIAYPIDKIKENIAQISLTYLDNENKIEENYNNEKSNGEISASKTEQPVETEEINNYEHLFEKIGNGIVSFFKDLF